jgi:hypothetical protein
MDILFEVLSALVLGVVTQRYRKEKDRKEWALVSRKPDKKTGKRKVLYWFGTQKPSKEKVSKQEKRVQWFKNKG